MAQEQLVIDPVVLARRIKAARALAGYKTGHEVADALRGMGVDISRRSYYAWENGEWMPTLEAFAALVLVLDPPGGVLWFEEAMRPDVAEGWRRMHEVEA